ncbi:MAG: hypothetical protein AB7P23_11090, partial [Amphiplicatus sp.]
FFGGAVSAKYLVATGADDDNFDWTDGWIGNLQFGLVVQASGRGDNGIEGDNRENTFDNLPRSNPSLSNLTLIGRGASSGEGIQVRHGTDGKIINAIVANWSEGLEWNADGVTPPQPIVDATAINGNVKNFAGSGQTVFNAGANNKTNTSDTLVGIIPGPNEKSPVITALDASATLGSFFLPATYVGAFGPTETATNNWTSGWTIGVPGASVACPAGTTDTGAAVPAGRPESHICKLPATITGTLNLVAGNLYQISGATFVGQDRGADPANPTVGATAGTLNIEAGVTLFSDGKDNSFDILIVSRGSQIFVNGSSAAPVVMTSIEALNGSPTSGDWGGLYINGRAPINHCTVNASAVGGAVDCNKTGEAGSGIFGGATATDSSGRLNYLRIEYAGHQFTSTNEANSLTLQGVGSGTEVDYVNTLFGKDDGIELFGGTVNVKHLVLVGAEDDSFDVTDGWVGKAQFVIVKQDATFVDNDNGIEFDNRENTFDNLPRTNGVMSNFTLIGDGSNADGEAIQIRNGAQGRLINTIATNFVEGLEFTRNGTLTPDPTVDSLILNANELPLPANDQFSGLGGTIFAAGSFNLKHDTSTLTNFAGTTTPLVPGANEVTTVTDPTAIDATFFSPVTYVGAVKDASDNWFIGWTKGL